MTGCAPRRLHGARDTSECDALCTDGGYPYCAFLERFDVCAGLGRTDTWNCSVTDPGQAAIELWRTCPGTNATEDSFGPDWPTSIQGALSCNRSTRAAHGTRCHVAPSLRESNELLEVLHCSSSYTACLCLPYKSKLWELRSVPATTSCSVLQITHPRAGRTARTNMSARAASLLAYWRALLTSRSAIARAPQLVQTIACLRTATPPLHRVPLGSSAGLETALRQATATPRTSAGDQASGLAVRRALSLVTSTLSTTVANLHGSERSTISQSATGFAPKQTSRTAYTKSPRGGVVDLVNLTSTAGAPDPGATLRQPERCHAAHTLTFHRSSCGGAHVRTTRIRWTLIDGCSPKVRSCQRTASVQIIGA